MKSLANKLSSAIFKIMKKRLYPFLIVAIISLPTPCFSSGFRLPLLSVSGVALNGALLTRAREAGSSYYNPAATAFMPEGNFCELSETTIVLAPVDYHDNRTPVYDGSSSQETFFMPQYHQVFQSHGAYRLGFSLVSPFGLSKRWEAPFPRATAEEFSLTVAEANPNLSIRLSEQMSLGAGVRLAYAKGIARTRADNPPISAIDPLTSISQDMSGDDISGGYNLAILYRPLDRISLAATYRSRIDYNLNGNADLKAYIGSTLVDSYQGGGSLKFSTPAVMAIASGFTVIGADIELLWEHTYWSCYDSIDFQYDGVIGASFSAFDQPQAKNWHGTDAYTISVSHDFNPSIEGMLGFSYENNPVPDESLGFDLPDADALTWTAGVNYRLKKNICLNMAVLYNRPRDREINNLDDAGNSFIDGSFTSRGSSMLALGANYIW